MGDPPNPAAIAGPAHDRPAPAAGPRVLAEADLRWQPHHWQRLAHAIGSGDLVVAPRGDADATERALASVEIAILAGDLDARHLAAPHLRWVHCDQAGLERSAHPDVFRRGLRVTGSAGRSAESIAEHVLLFALLLASHYPVLYEAQRRRAWLDPAELGGAHPLRGRTMGIVGLGHTGTAVARLATAFGMHVVGYRRRLLDPPPSVARVWSMEAGDDLRDLLRVTDVLVLAASLTDITYRLIDAPALAHLRPNAVVINVARGGILDQDALIAALQEGRLAGAGLDVTDPEPLPPESPLWTAPNAWITPHFTAAAPDRADRSLDIVLENLRRYDSGEPLLNELVPSDAWSR